MESSSATIHNKEPRTAKSTGRNLVGMLKTAVRTLLSAPCRCYLKRKSTYKCKGEDDEQLIVSMTSWKERIHNVPAVVESIYRNSVKPDKMVLNLSLEEFPHKEEDLPREVVDCQEDGRIEIFWNEGNAKAFKKFIPTMQKYPTAAIITIDDDFIYPEDFIATFAAKHKAMPGCPLSGNREVYSGVQAHCGCASLVKKSYFGPYVETLLDDDVISMRYDDIFYTFCITLNGLRYEYVGKLFYTNMEPNNPVCGLSDSTEGVTGNIRDHLVAKIKRLYHLNLSELSQPIFWI